ncbi:probable serine/threonine-protein kinase ifkA [Scylla paramamosain]|uniref:probable serine/threonine-protein kinase ifkA n=1 Tax=Scylla paramamosain TaxID=85552 RepID=UPI00308312EF
MRTTWRDPCGTPPPFQSGRARDHAQSCGTPSEFSSHAHVTCPASATENHAHARLGAHYSWDTGRGTEGLSDVEERWVWTLAGLKRKVSKIYDGSGPSLERPPVDTAFCAAASRGALLPPVQPLPLHSPCTSTPPPLHLSTPLPPITSKHNHSPSCTSSENDDDDDDNGDDTGEQDNDDDNDDDSKEDHDNDGDSGDGDDQETKTMMMMMMSISYAITPVMHTPVFVACVCSCGGAGRDWPSKHSEEDGGTLPCELRRF